MIGTENFWWSEENYCDSRHLRGNIDGFLRDGNREILIETQIGHVATFVYKMYSPLGRLGAAGPLRRLTQTISPPGAGLAM